MDQRPDDHDHLGALTHDMPCGHCGHAAHPIDRCERCTCQEER